MSIERIDLNQCVGCGNCVRACTMDVIRFNETERVPVIQYPKDCYCCYSCEIDCPAGAIYVNPRRLRPIPRAWS